ncbi:adhesion G protein-coupled receptor F5-like [Archocentrus centrarchus]|uniref:adhesion G protein-coupled receptor F5-like n=1 Tax=Archocentrus centrarchus TaxID=63155 RepID=UPI0011EA092C|nr:adhesion G protein-coupled receptor F5-like [Archocentrus centrarchus]
MAIFGNALTIVVLLVILIILETGKVNEFSGLVLQESHEAEHFHPHTRHRRNELRAEFEYEVDLELNVTDIATVDYLRSLFNTASYSITLDPAVNITHTHITTVCYPSGTSFQCKCEDEYLWSYGNCNTYGACDEIIEDACTCINSIPFTGQYCQPKRVCRRDAEGLQCRCENNYVWPCDMCATYGECDGDANSTCTCIRAIPTEGQSCQSAQQNITRCPLTTTSPSTASITPAVFYEYQASVQLHISEINRLRTILNNISYPIKIDSHTQISNISISTVCDPSSGGLQCKCEDQYRWSCDQCLLYGSCDNITNDTCGCINALPLNGQYCQAVDQHNFTPCPQTTGNPLSTTSPFTHEYLVSVQLNTTEVTVVNLLRTVVNNMSYPIHINSQIELTDINISTVCSPNSGSFQCKCENGYRWSCDQCVMHGPCDSITDDTCGCINTIPPVGQYCQSVYQHNFTTCSPTTTAALPTTPPVVYEYLISIELITTDITIINKVRAILRNISYPISINNHINIYDIHISTVCSPSSGGFQCKCEDGYRWPCDQCLMFRPCDSITDHTCGCINRIPPDGQYCQSGYQHNFTACPVTTPIPTPTEFTTYPSTTAPTTRQLEHTLQSPFLKMGATTQVCQSSGTTPDLHATLEQRQGSVITDFVVQTKQVDQNEMTEANTHFTEALQSVAAVIGSVIVHFFSSGSVSTPDETYTGKTMTLICGPTSTDNIKIGTVSDSVWKFNDLEIKSERIKIDSSNNQSKLIVKNVIPADAGRYECILKSRDFNFIQSGVVKEAQIKQAPIVQVQSKINVKCKQGQKQPLQCCVQSPYKVTWYNGSSLLISENVEKNCIKYDYEMKSCNGSQAEEKVFTCKVDEPKGYEQTTKLTIFTEGIECNDSEYGAGRAGDRATKSCDKGQEGNKTAECQKTGKWTLVEDICVIIKINQLFTASQDLVVEKVPNFVAELSETVSGSAKEIANSSATISAIVNILNNIANVSTNVNETVMQNVLNTIDVIIGDDAKKSWGFLNEKANNASSALLGSLETLTNGLDGRFSIATERITLNRTTFNNSFTGDLNTNFFIKIPHTDIFNVFITTITFPTLSNVMPVRNSTFDTTAINNNVNATSNETHETNDAINAAVVLVKIDATIQSVTLSYKKLNTSLSQNPQCVFWNFTLFDNLGAWDNEGCTFVSDENDNVTCHCNHLTSFSILMSTRVPPLVRKLLDIITYIGVGISLASLVICLIIEGCVWKVITRNSTAFMRHVSIINTALSLLIADICFIIGAAIAKNPSENPGENYDVPVGPCSTATFFMHFFYLALFFWMLVSALLLFYRTVMVFSHMSKSTMLAIGFSLGYGCPLIIAMITVAVTASNNGYIRDREACWLNWNETKALLAFVIPALTIVVINILIVIVVLFKMMRRGVGDTVQRDEKHTLIVILRCVAILTPLFGLTWSLGVGTMVSPTNRGIHIAFASFNSFQGFFILLFGTLFDSKIRMILSRRVPRLSTSSSKSTSTGIFTFSGINLINRLRRRQYHYRVSEAENSNSSGASESFMYI